MEKVQEKLWKFSASYFSTSCCGMERDKNERKTQSVKWKDTLKETLLLINRSVCIPRRDLWIRNVTVITMLISHRLHHRIITFKINKRIITWELELSLNLIMFHNLNSKLAFMYLPPFHIIWDNLRMNISHVWRYTIT